MPVAKISHATKILLNHSSLFYEKVQMNFFCVYKGNPDLKWSFNMNIYIVGTSGVGKTTLANQLSQKYGLEHVELDAELFLEGWKARKKSVFRKRVMKKVFTLQKERKSWIMCGNYRVIIPRLSRDLDLIIWLDYSFYLIFWRLLKRTFRRLLSQEKCCGDNQESWRQQFYSRKSIFLWMFKTFLKNKIRYSRLMQKETYKHKVVRLRSPKELRYFVKKINERFSI